MKIKIKVSKEHQKLNEACFTGDLVKVKAVIEDGLNLAEIWTAEAYPLNIAMQIGSVELARLLVDHGMPLYWNHKYSYQSLDYADLMSAEEEICQRFVYGGHYVNQNSLSVALALLDYAKQVNTPDPGYSGLCCASGLENKYTSDLSDAYVERLLELGGDVDHIGANGESLLHLLVLGKNDRYVGQFIRLSKDVNRLSSTGASPLMAAVKGRWLAVRVLLECGAHTNFYNRHRKETALDYLVRYLKNNSYENRDGAIDEMVELMRAHGAKTYAEMVRDCDIQEAPQGD